ncbi:MAG TPA: biopolymer transporter ExbD [Flavobacteriales bacterium]|nr:biopolymer transporter ExbD [Flavobacteriales bacterium]HIA13177.1 biopolymer transporter ExbD [Flavobacteriales bacterium]
MSKFQRKSKGGTPAISTASLPDIVFMLLFFFMVTTVMREVSLKVVVSQPKATEVKKLEKKSLVSYIYIGPPIIGLAAAYGTEPRIQLNDAFATVSDLGEFIIAEREARNEKEVPFMTTSLKVDKTVKMGIVTDVKQELRELNALKINYSTKKGTDITAQ